MRPMVSMMCLLLGLLAVSPAVAVERKTSNGQPTNINMGFASVQVTPPAGWFIETPFAVGLEPVLADAKRGARVTLTGTRMPLHPHQFDRMRQECLLNVQRRVKTKELVSFEEKTVDGVPGVLVVDPGKEPLRRSLIWYGYGGAGVYTFYFYCEPQFFAGYQPTFLQVLDSIHFQAQK
jgi:hypothetical protein